MDLLPRTSRLRTALAYAGMVVLAVALFLVLRSRGELLHAPPAPAEAANSAGAGHTALLAHVLLALAAITVLARLVGSFFGRCLRQPPVMGEILAGVMLGPSLLGAVAPAAYDFLLPSTVVPFLGVIAKLGVVLFMFLVGLELDPHRLRGNAHATIAISHASIVAPFLLGGLLALGLYPVYSTSNVPFTTFALFLGVSLSVTAFPVLARILIDRKAQGTGLGMTALACAAVGDVTAWTLLAFVSGIACAQLSGAGWQFAWLLVYVGVMLVVVKPLVRRFAARQDARQGPLSQAVLAVVFIGILLSAVATESIGIHALFGAFMLGALLPHEGRLAEGIRARLEDAVVVLLLPSFFALTGMKTQVGLLDSGRDWLVCGLIVLVATAGKFGGTFVAARLTGLAARPAAALGILMNTRGLMELIVLDVGLELKVITPTIFTMMVIMALVTTFSATPVLDRMLGDRGFADGPAVRPSRGPGP